MRTYGRVTNKDGSKTWVTITTPTDGDNTLIWLVTLCQVLLLFLNESPFFGNYGIPAKASVMTQVFPDYYVTVTQGQFAQYFTSLIVYKQSLPTPTYVINVTTVTGQKLQVNLEVPQ